jgi:outer membrane immunogenic protein
MKHLRIFGTVAAFCTLLASTAWTADMSIPRKAPAPSAYDWTGVYFGGQIGGGWSRVDYADPSAVPLLNSVVAPGDGISATGPGSNPNSNSFLAGAQLGWMYQIGRLVIGSDVDWSYTAFKGNGSISYTGNLAGFLITDVYDVSTHWTATATATLGVARDRWLPYVKGGAAFARNNYAMTMNLPADISGTAFAIPASSSGTSIGWTVGAGMRWAFSDNWFVNLEYDFLNFGAQSPNLAAVCPVNCLAPVVPLPMVFNPTINQSISEVKFELNYKLGADSVFW